MGREWDDPTFAEKWIRAQRGEGDEWRADLINPVVRTLCEAMSDRKAPKPFDFSVFESLALARENRSPKPNAWAGVTVIDLGCGEGCLGSVVSAGGAAYRGFDVSPYLIEHAREQRGLAGVELVDLAALSEEGLKQALGELGPQTLITCVLVLEHLEEPASLLARLAACLASTKQEVPVVVVTLARNSGSDSPAGEPSPLVKIPIPSMEGDPDQKPSVQARPVYQRRWAAYFRDAGFMVRSCEPLCFSPETPRGDPLYPYAFWCWRLAARRQLHRGDDWIREATEALEGLPEPLRRVECMRVYDVPRGARFINALNIGGELTILLRGQAQLRVADLQSGARDVVIDEAALGPTHGSLLFRPGHLFGELEAAGRGGPAYYAQDVIAASSDCRVAVIPNNFVQEHLRPDPSSIDGFFFDKLRGRFQLDALRDGIVRMGTGDTIGNVASVDLRRLARILLWASAIERRHRCQGDADTAVWLNLLSVATIFQPDRDKPDGLNKALRLLHRLRVVDVLPVGYLYTIDKDICRDIDRLGNGLIAKACHTHLEGMRANGFNEREIERAIDDLNLMGRKMFAVVEGTGRDARWKSSREVREWLERLKKVGLGDESAAKLESYLVRLSLCWHDQGSNHFIVIRDRYALQQLGLGSAKNAHSALTKRQKYLDPPSPETAPKEPSKARSKQAWTTVLNLLEPVKQRAYLETLSSFCESDLRPAGSQSLRFSDELATR